MTLDDLEALAKAATPGPWRINADDETIDATITNSAGTYDANLFYEMDPTDPDVVYIAAASPDVILDLIRRVREAERERDNLRRESLEEPPGGLGPWDGVCTHLAYKIAANPVLVRGPYGQTAHCVGEEAKRSRAEHRTLCGDSAPYLLRKAIPWMTSMVKLVLLMEDHEKKITAERDAALAKLAEAEAAHDLEKRAHELTWNTKRDTALARVREVEAERDVLEAELRGVHCLRSVWPSWYDHDQAFLQEACDVRAEVSECAQCGPRAEAAMEAVRAAIASVEAPKEEPKMPEARYNGGVRCDMDAGPCACGAWHKAGEPFAPIPDAPPSDGGARQMDEAIARREASIAELEARVEALEERNAALGDAAEMLGVLYPERWFNVPEYVRRALRDRDEATARIAHLLRTNQELAIDGARIATMRDAAIERAERAKRTLQRVREYALHCARDEAGTLAHSVGERTLTILDEESGR